MWLFEVLASLPLRCVGTTGGHKKGAAASASMKKVAVQRSWMVKACRELYGAAFHHR